MKIFASILFTCLSVFSAIGQDNDKPRTDSAIVPITGAIIFSVPDGYGYDIYVDGQRYIHQVNIPSVPGTKGFETEADALKVATLVRKKIENNIMPPSITPEELDSLGVYELKGQ